MDENKLKSLLTELKAKVKESSGKIREDKLIYMINLMARTEMELRKNGNICTEELEKEIMKFVSDDKFKQENKLKIISNNNLSIKNNHYEKKSYSKQLEYLFFRKSF
ncbi:MAG: hypothetical protein IPL53_23970 [Ignavibacteria bacterium]|nr:hypothetical protein [Ignavibacteria bacterium]